MDNEIKTINEKMKELKNKDNNHIKEIRNGRDEKMKELNNEKKELKNDKNKKVKENIVRRMATKFFLKYLYVNEQREVNGFTKLSLPKFTSLVIRHDRWHEIEKAIIFFNKEIENEEKK